MTVYDQDFLGSLLVELGIITSTQLNEATEERERTGKPLGHILVEFGFIDERDMLNVIADNLGMEVVEHGQNRLIGQELDAKFSTLVGVGGIHRAESAP